MLSFCLFRSVAEVPLYAHKSAFHNGAPQRRLIHKRAFERFPYQLCPQAERFPAISSLGIFSSHCRSKRGTAPHGIAYSFERAGTDKSRRFTYEKHSVISEKKVPSRTRTQNGAALRFKRLTKIIAEFFKPFLLLLESFSRPVHGVCPSENGISAFGYCPRTAIRDFFIENT